LIQLAVADRAAGQQAQAGVVLVGRPHRVRQIGDF
jgi:hypothetical protein